MSVSEPGESQDGPRVFRVGDPPPPTDVEALLDHKNGYWPRMGPDCWNCPGNEPHTWNEMAPAGPFVEAPRLPDVAAAIAADEARRKAHD